MAQKGAIFVFCSSCKILNFANYISFRIIAVLKSLFTSHLWHGQMMAHVLHFSSFFSLGPITPDFVNVWFWQTTQTTLTKLTNLTTLTTLATLNSLTNPVQNHFKTSLKSVKTSSKSVLSSLISLKIWKRVVENQNILTTTLPITRQCRWAAVKKRNWNS